MACWNLPADQGEITWASTLVAPGRFSRDGDVVRVAAECRDVALHPVKSEALVHLAVVGKGMALAINGGMGEEAEHAQTIVQGHDHRFTIEYELAGIVVAALADPEAPAMDPDEDPQRLAGLHGGSRHVDVQVEAVLTATRRGESTEVGILDAGLTDLGRIMRLSPGARSLWRPPAQFADRRRGVGNAQIGQHLTVIDPTHWAAVDLHDGGWLGCLGHADTEADAEGKHCGKAFNKWLHWSVVL